MFRVGMKVCCIKVGRWTNYDGTDVTEASPRYGEVYTIRGFDSSGKGGLLFSEIRSKDVYFDGTEVGWNQIRFRPAVDPKQEVSFTTGAPEDSEKWDNRVKRKPQKAVTALQS